VTAAITKTAANVLKTRYAYVVQKKAAPAAAVL